MQADGGVTGRPNAICPLAYDGADVEAAIDEAVMWQAERGLSPCFKIADNVCAPVDLPARLRARGWRADTETLVMTARLYSGGGASGAAAMLTPDYVDAFDSVVRETSASPAEYAERSGLSRRTPQPRRFAVLARDGVTAAVGQSVVTGDHAAIFLMRTAPAFRRQGLARKILTALLGWAQSEGASHAYLQVEAANAPAIALYERAGFKMAYAYRYWRVSAAR